MSDVSGLMAAIDKMIPRETIDGGDVWEIAESMVDLDVAHSPVVADPLPGDPATTYTHVPAPCRVEREGDRFCLVFGNDFRWLSPREARVMRARYLLLRGYYAKRLEQDSLSYPEQQRVLANYFPGGFLNLKKLMESK